MVLFNHFLIFRIVDAINHDNSWVSTQAVIKNAYISTDSSAAVIRYLKHKQMKTMTQLYFETFYVFLTTSRLRSEYYLLKKNSQSKSSFSKALTYLFKIQIIILVYFIHVFN